MTLFKSFKRGTEEVYFPLRERAELFSHEWESSVLKIPWCSTPRGSAGKRKYMEALTSSRPLLPTLSYRWKASRHNLIYPD